MREPKPSTPVETQLILVTPLIADPAAFLPALTAALAAGPVAAVIARLEPADDRTLVNRIKALVPAVQGAGAALMAEAPVDAVARGGADGIHLAYGAERLAEAVDRLAPQRMVGVAGLKSRDDAMAAGERADYVMFGEPLVSRHAEKNGTLPPFHAVVERVAWWAELFEVPVVGYAQDMAGVQALAAVHADFVAIEAPVWDHAEGPAAGVKQALAAIAAAKAAA
jgi:thiamine-phosphate pyrophosphorylase